MYLFTYREWDYYGLESASVLVLDTQEISDQVIKLFSLDETRYTFRKNGNDLDVDYCGRRCGYIAVEPISIGVVVSV